MPKDNKDPVQEQLIAARRSQILDAATKVFAEKGFSRATIRDVAQEAGVADGTIYIYFKNKTDLVLGLLDRINETDQRDSDMAPAVDMDLRTFMEFYLRQRYTLFAEGGLEVIRAILPEVMVNPELRKQYMDTIIEPTYDNTASHFETMIDMGKMRPLDIPLAMRVISATTLGLVLLWILEDPVIRQRWGELPKILTEMTLDGILPKEE